MHQGGITNLMLSKEREIHVLLRIAGFVTEKKRLDSLIWVLNVFTLLFLGNFSFPRWVHEKNLGWRFCWVYSTISYTQTYYILLTYTSYKTWHTSHTLTRLSSPLELPTQVGVHSTTPLVGAQPTTPHLENTLSLLHRRAPTFWTLKYFLET